MNAVDQALDAYGKTFTIEDRFQLAGALFEAERKVLEMIAPKYYCEDEVISFVYYHLHGEQLPNDFFVQRLVWLERRRDDRSRE